MTDIMVNLAWGIAGVAAVGLVFVVMFCCQVLWDAAKERFPVAVDWTLVGARFILVVVAMAFFLTLFGALVRELLA